MSSENLSRKIWIALDFLIWIAPSMVFFAFYLRFPPTNAAAIVPHLLVLVAAFYLFCVLRFVTAKYIGSTKWLTACFAVCVSLAILVLSTYYVLVITGLNSWGQVVTWALIKSYLKQSPMLLEALGLSKTLVLVLVIAAFLILASVSYWYLQRFNWSASGKLAANHRLPKPISLVLFGATILSSFYLVTHFYLPNAATTEPFVLTFAGGSGTGTFRGFAKDASGAAMLDAEQDLVRNSYQPTSTSIKPNLILVVVDALRADHMQLYGYQRETTPYLQRLKDRAQTQFRVIKGVRSTCAESACGLFSLASSKYYHEVSSQPFMLNQVLKAHGYQTRMIMGGDHTNFYGLRQLYGDVDFYIDGSDSSASYLNADRWVVQQTELLPTWSGQPTMIQFHLMSAHPLGLRESEFTKFTPADNYSISIVRPTLTQASSINFYDNGVLQVDAIINELIDRLKSKGYLDKALVVITGDHAEALGEKGFYSHAKNLYEPAIRVPLVLINFGYQAAEISENQVGAAQVDIAPTVLTDFSMPIPPNWRGRALQNPIEPRITYLQQGYQLGLVDSRFAPNLYKAWINQRTGEFFAFNLKDDPNEDVNLGKSNDPLLRAKQLEWRLILSKQRLVSDAR
jgi:glucan phosphoethanolaminetransferase (alkaline phosphatase superfamily)